MTKINKKIVMATSLATILLISICAVQISVKSVYASGITYVIDAAALNGGDCNTIGTWNSATKTCSLKMNLTNDNISIVSDNTTLDGKNHKMTGDKTVNGIYSTQNGITVKNLRIENYGNGVFLSGTGDALINNISNNNSNNGFAINTSHATIKDNKANNNGNYGISAAAVIHSTINNNSANNNGNWGILASGGDCILKSNSAKDNVEHQIVASGDNFTLISNTEVFVNPL
jgi:hypothetical protein